MRLARRALVAALATLMLCAAVSAQTLRAETDPRNISPAVGTGGPVAGPTGLFTIYDGQTLRRGEFTFSIAYSNFDRDPGNVDLNEVPLSFNVGLNDHLELFFNTTAWRGIKVNNPQNLSSFYLPNSQLKFPGLGSGAAIVMAPNATVITTLGRSATFRPAFNQPFVQFPFVGGSAGTFAQGPGNAQNGNFGCPGCVFTLGAPFGTGSSGNFGPADNFPGVGSVVGSILPGIVLATTTLPATLLTQPIVVPATFTIEPSYLPDAPFINRIFGESSFTSFVAGVKWRWTEPDNPLGVGIMPFYRYYPDKGDDFSGFNQLQRGASPGGDIGDFGLLFFLDARLSRSVNVSVNGGYILNSNPKGTFPTGEFTLLDRPDEFLAGVGFDFPVNKYFQPVLELRSTHYVGGRTPNAFENSPVDALAGVKIYSKRSDSGWQFGFGLAYRMHINQQDRSLFSGRDFNATVQQITNVNPIGPAPLTVVPATTVASTVGGFPRGFIESDDANGFIAQFWIGKRNERDAEEDFDFGVSLPPDQSILLPYLGECPAGWVPSPECKPNSNGKVELTAKIDALPMFPITQEEIGSDFAWRWSVTEGPNREKVKISPDGSPAVTVDFTDADKGVYTIVASAEYNCGKAAALCTRRAETKITVDRCHCEQRCPTNVEVACPASVNEGDSITFSATVTNSNPQSTYVWTVMAGNTKLLIATGENTPTITVDTKDLGGQTVKADVKVSTPNCPDLTAWCETVVIPPRTCRRFDDYGDLRFDDEKARLDNFAIQLQQEPDATGYYIVSGTCQDGPCTLQSCVDAQKRAARAKDYLVNVRLIAPGRIVTMPAEGCREEVAVELWICPIGAVAPTPTNPATVHPCPACKANPRPYRRRRARYRGRRYR